MTGLSGNVILESIESGVIEIKPFNREKQIGVASVDLRLGNIFRVHKRKKGPIDLRTYDANKETDVCIVKKGGTYKLRPKQFVSGVTLERVTIPNDMVAHLDGKCSLAGCGIEVHSTSARIDPGWSGHITLEIYNKLNRTLILYPGMRFCALEFTYLSSTSKPYKGKYSGSTTTPAGSRISEEFANMLPKLRKGDRKRSKSS